MTTPSSLVNIYALASNLSKASIVLGCAKT